MAENDLPTIRVGSRKSQLALIQTEDVIRRLKDIYPDRTFEIVSMSTIGDNVLDRALSKIGEKSLFTKELETALIDHSVDLVVHSLKDLPTSLPEGLILGAICKREAPHDAVVMSPRCKDKTLKSLPEGSVIGTSSLRRVAQLKKQFPHLKFLDVRGNLNTRLNKLDNDDTYDALVLALAGLIRMGWRSRVTHVLPPDECLHAVGQGALAVECRADDKETLSLIGALQDKETLLQCVAERSFMKTLEGGCSVPIGVCCTYVDGELNLQGGVFSLDGSESIVDQLTKVCDAVEKNNPNVPVIKKRKHDNEETSKAYASIVANGIADHTLQTAADIGTQLAKQLLDKGASAILNQARKDNEAS